jgi:hypothetical protein
MSLIYMLSHSDIDMAKLYKMIFIYNAINDGWIVEKGSNNEIIFIKDRRQCIAKPEDFIKQNLMVPEDLIE